MLRLDYIEVESNPKSTFFLRIMLFNIVGQLSTM